MTYEDLIVLIPCHSLEEFPTDLGDEDAESLLNAFAVLWHPRLLASSKVIPSWHQADMPPDVLENRLILIPTPCADLIPADWIEQAEQAGAVVVSQTVSRDDWIQAVLEPLGQSEPNATPPQPPESDHPESESLESDSLESDSLESDSLESDSLESDSLESDSLESDSPPPEPDPGENPENVVPQPDSPEPVVDSELIADFLALGSGFLQMELLTRHMHHFSSLDEVHLQREAISAAQAALADDIPAAQAHLRNCFEVLTEARERFYPVECYLIDLCLVIPRLAEEHFEQMLPRETPVNYLLTAADLDEIVTDRPALGKALRDAWDAGRCDIVGGELQEGPSPLLPVESVLWAFAEGHKLFRKHLGRVPTTWGRRRYGLSTLMPQILNRFGYHSALHVVLDDGIYPDAEESKIRWEGCDGTVLDAMTRIPLAADSASSFLRLAERLAESMEQDQVAALLFARWPEQTTPWLDDLHRMQRYSNCLGRFVPFDEFFRETDDPGRMATYEPWEYLSPFLIQAVAREEPNPVSRFADAITRRHCFDAARWYRALARLLQGVSVDDEESERVERILEKAGPDLISRTSGEASGGTRDEDGINNETGNGNGNEAESVDSLLETFQSASAGQLAERLMPANGNEPGILLLNALAHPRRVTVDVPQFVHPPEVAGPIKHVQFDDRHHAITVDLPGSGFVRISCSVPDEPADNEHPATKDLPRTRTPATAESEISLVEDNVLRNEFFEVHINEETGGIARIKGHGRQPNRLSQQIAFRFPQERTVTIGQGNDARTVQTCYSTMRCRSCETTCRGPALGEVVTTGDILDTSDGSKLADFQQTVRVWRGRPVVEIDLTIDPLHLPEGNPWNTYYAARFAWNDSTAALTRSTQQGACSLQAGSFQAGSFQTGSLHGERFESPHFIEIATETMRTTILTMGLPFHRKTGPRMIDSILIPAGETKRRFRFVIAVDQNYPMQAALDAMTPVAIVPTVAGPSAPESGWFFHLDAKNVQILSLQRLLPIFPTAGDDLAKDDSAADDLGWNDSEEVDLPTGAQSAATSGWSADDAGASVRLLETEGRHRSIRLRCYRTPASARQRDFQGRTITILPIEDDAVLIEITPYEIAEIEIRFEDTAS